MRGSWMKPSSSSVIGRFASGSRRWQGRIAIVRGPDRAVSEQSPGLARDHGFFPGLHDEGPAWCRRCLHLGDARRISGQCRIGEVVKVQAEEARRGALTTASSLSAVITEPVTDSANRLPAARRGASGDPAFRPCGCCAARRGCRGVRAAPDSRAPGPGMPHPLRPSAPQARRLRRVP